MEIVAIQKYLNTSPRKIRLVADLVRSMKPKAALGVLKFTRQAAAKPLSKAINTALSNARQQNIVVEDLIFKKMEVNEGPVLKRFRAGSRGRAKPYKKRISHIKIVLSDELIVDSKEKNVKKEGKHS